MRKPPVCFVQLVLLSLTEVAGFFPGGLTPRIANSRHGTAVAAASAAASQRTSAAADAAAAASSDSLAATAVVFSFGLTHEERLVAKESVFGRGQLFPAGVEVLDATARGGTLREAVLRLTTTESATSPVRAGAPDTPLQDATLETPDFMPRLLLILSPVPSSSSDDGSGAACEGGNAQLLLSVMEALDACEAVPPAIVCCPPPSTTRGGGQRSAGQSSQGLQKLLDEFEPALLDTQLSDLWRQEAEHHFESNGLASPLRVHDTAWTPSEHEPRVALNLELDGAWVDSPASTGGRRWDTSKIVVLDGLVDENLSKNLLDLVTEPGWVTSPGEARDSTKGKQPAAREAPPLSKWERGLSDIELDPSAAGGRGAGAGSWGLTNEGMEWLCQEGKHPALVEVQSRLCKLYPDFEISHMPEAVLGASTPRMVANAPVYGDQFSWHVDADPAVLPPSPWRDYFGTYTNREPGMPLFTTLLIYLDAEWRREWDAETLFLDAPTGTGVFVRPRGGRAVMMDQDVTHRISTPSQAAARPRYSLVWKLVFSPRRHDRQGRQSSGTESTTPAAAAAATAATTTAAAAAAAAAASASSGSSSSSGSGDPSIALPGWGNSVRFGSAQGPPRAHQHDHDDPPPPPPPQVDSSVTTLPVYRENALGHGVSSQAASGSDSDTERAADASVGEGDRGGEGASSPAVEAEDSPMVEVKPVGAKGMGLFSARPIAEGVVVGFYTGEVLSLADLDARYPDFEGSEYVMQVGPDRYLDARDPEQSGITRYVNHSGQPNLVVELRPAAAPSTASDGRGGDSHGDGVALTTLRAVAEGEELTFDYGEGYFDGEDEGSVIEDGEEMQDLLGGIDWGSNTLSA